MLPHVIAVVPDVDDVAVVQQAINRANEALGRKYVIGTSLQEKLASLPSDRQVRIKAETVHLQATYMTLKDLQRAQNMTQVHLAKQLGKSQVTIAHDVAVEPEERERSERSSFGSLPVVHGHRPRQGWPWKRQ